MTKLQAAELHYPSAEPLDRNGRVFFWQGGVYRGIGPTLAPLYRQLLASPAAEPLFQAGLVRTEVTDLQLDGYDLVLCHERVPVISYVTEWSFSMLRAAALLTLDLSDALDEQGLELQDAHPWNVLFEGTTPRFVDFTSIAPIGTGGGWRPLDEFIGTFLNPLVLMANGLHRQARSLLVDWRTGRGRRIGTGDAVRELGRARRLAPLAAFLLEQRPAARHARREQLATLRQLVNRLELPPEKTRWSEYCAEEVDESTLAQWMPKRKTALQVLERCQPQTLLDIGSNTGWFSKLAARQGARVISFDVDEPSINKLFDNPEAKRLGILPLAMDFRAPTPRYGIAGRCTPATERFRCEMVFALAIVHHLVFGQHTRFDAIVASLAAFTGKWLLVEFIPKEDVHVAKMYDDSFSWYTLDAFQTELGKHFATVEVLPSNPEPRVLLLCTR